MAELVERYFENVSFEATKMAFSSLSFLKRNNRH
jgi:hypothetical protein